VEQTPTYVECGSCERERNKEKKEKKRKKRQKEKKEKTKDTEREKLTYVTSELAERVTGKDEWRVVLLRVGEHKRP
jgi:hypothetical protein